MKSSHRAPAFAVITAHSNCALFCSPRLNLAHKTSPSRHSRLGLPVWPQMSFLVRACLYSFVFVCYFFFYHWVIAFRSLGQFAPTPHCRPPTTVCSANEWWSHKRRPTKNLRKCKYLTVQPAAIGSAGSGSPVTGRQTRRAGGLKVSPHQPIIFSLTLSSTGRGASKKQQHQSWGCRKKGVCLDPILYRALDVLAVCYFS